MVFKLTDKPSVANQYLKDLRSVDVQQDRMRFRNNLRRISEILAYEVSKTFDYQDVEVETPLGIAATQTSEQRVVIASILRAGLPMHDGLLNIFDRADNAFISAYRRHHKDGSFDVHLQYVTCPDLNDAVLILADPMLATGASVDIVIKELLNFGKPKQIHLITAIASSYGLEHVQRVFPDINIWMGDLDDELTGKSYIVPGLGDAGDLAYGSKLQE
jgi:uracil phosphoribosyltransferase